jgi:hypothetical protein
MLESTKAHLKRDVSTLGASTWAWDVAIAQSNARAVVRPVVVAMTLVAGEELRCKC